MNEKEDKIIDGIHSANYLWAEFHHLLQDSFQLKGGPNIGINGENLTISFLSLNRSSLSIRLLSSIAEKISNFAGEVLVIDNGSEPNEILELEKTCLKMPYSCRVVKLGANFGVAGGRNRTIPFVKTDWIMFLDNDIFFVENPLKNIQKDIGNIGCHFINLPLLDKDGCKVFAKGGHLYTCLENGEIHIGAGSAYVQGIHNGTNVNAFLSTFLFGGASIVKKETFLKMGGFDEGMFIGFEDLDFSIRLFQHGMKIGNTGVMALVHAHAEPSSKQDQDYEKKRFSYEIIKQSAQYFEKKYGMKVWNECVSEWLKDRQRKMGIATEECHQFMDSCKTEKKLPRIALIVDVENWAFGNISRQLQRYLSKQFEFKIIPMTVVENIIQLLLMVRDCDIVHFFWREHLTLIDSPYYKSYVEEMRINYDKFKEEVIAPRIFSTAAYDHLLLGNHEIAERVPIFQNLITGYYVSSQRLNTIYSNIKTYPEPMAILEDGVDLTLFKPINLERFDHIKERKIVIGWSGNSQWADELEDFKGVNTILKPAIEELQAEGMPIKTYFADRAERMIPHHEMVNYYSKIDVYICTSKIEGTPNPVLEAMACGVPVISTDVGIVPQAFGILQSEFILKERSVECLKEAIRKLIQQPHLFSELSKENLHQIEKWDWKEKTKGFGAYFNKLIEKKQMDNKLHNNF
jgi:glycosyltransferase involved in cell wall biosynthesis/GT2 family glycosyltransferase